MPVINVTCNGANDGRVCLTISAPNFPVNIEISHEISGVISNIATPVTTPPGASVTPSGSGADLDTPGKYCWDSLEPGKYTVYIIDTSPTPCIVNTEFEITEPDSLSVDYEIVSGNCNDGSVTIQASADGGTKFPSGGYRFTLDGGDLSSPINKNNGLFKNIPASTNLYTLTVTDGNNCTDTIDIDIQSTNEITIEYGFKNVSCFGACDGEISVVGTGGQPPYRFILISDPPGTFVKTNDCDEDGNSCVTSYIFKNLCAGDYTLKVVDANGCNFELPSSITIDQPTEIEYVGPVVLNVTCDDCCNGSIEITSITGGSPNYFVEITKAPEGFIIPSGINTDGSTPVTFSNLIAGMYEVTITDEDGCTKIIKVGVNSDPSITVVI